MLAAIDVFNKEIAAVARTLPDFGLFDRQCPTFLHQTFVEWVAQTINKSAFQRKAGFRHEPLSRAFLSGFVPGIELRHRRRNGLPWKPQVPEEWRTALPQGVEADARLAEGCGEGIRLGQQRVAAISAFSAICQPAHGYFKRIGIAMCGYSAKITICPGRTSILAIRPIVRPAFSNQIPFNLIHGTARRPVNPFLSLGVTGK
nr:hypothetical protein [Cupriavidus sp. IDO]